MNMRQGLHISQRLGLTQTLTPQMRMNLELIQAPILEAVQNIEQQVMLNPWLERNEEMTDPRFIREADRVTVAQPTAKQEARFEEAEAWFDPVAATPWTYEEFPADEAQGLMAVATPSPYEQLEAQIRELDIQRPAMELTCKLMHNVDGHGFLAPPKSLEELQEYGLVPRSLEGGDGNVEIAQSAETWLKTLAKDPDAWLMEFLQLQAEERPLLDQALQVLRYQLDPPGVGARTQSHSFLIQLERMGKADSLAARLIRDDVLADIKPRNLDAVAKKLGITTIELRSGLEDLRRLYRSPMTLIDNTVEPTRYPDLVVEMVDGEWQVSLSHPLSGRYRYRETRIPRKNSAEMRVGEGEEPNDDPAETLRRLRQMRQDARMLVRATEYRDRTLFEIGTQLVREQEEFLEKGEEALKPLLQKELAERLGLNEATVSRILKDKFMLTPRGLLPLNGFFSRSIVNKRGEKIANKAIQDALSKLITEEEDTDHPWSDQELSVLLRQRGFPISRRTVTKYRMLLKIGAAGDRKAQKKMQDGG